MCAGWTGENCDISVNDCVTNKCQHGASCVDGHLSYKCVCTPGYTGQCEHVTNSLNTLQSEHVTVGLE